MQPDKYTATWVSHSSMSDFLKCPRLYFLKNVYRDPKTNHKVQIMTPPLALGQIVHEVLESLSTLSVDQRFNESLVVKFDEAWERVKGKQGGFWDDEAEQKYKNRGKEMLRRVMNNPGPLKNLAVKIKEDLPFFWLSEEDNIILCGKIDWLEYFPETDSVHIIDFKTGKNEEKDDSLQIPIYSLLASKCQKRKVAKASYWYLDWSDELKEKAIPDLEETRKEILKIGRDMKLARQLKRFECPSGKEGCSACQSMEAIVRGEGELVGVSGFGSDIYILQQKQEEDVEDSYVI